MEDGIRGMPPTKDHALPGVPRAATPSPDDLSPPALVCLRHLLGQRWRRLRDRVIASSAVKAEDETLSPDEAFAAFLLDRLERELDGDGSGSPETLPGESRGQSGSPGFGTDGGDDGTRRANPPDGQGAPSDSKLDGLPRGEAGSSPPVEREKDVQAKVKRKRGRPRIETDDAEREAVLFNRRLRELISRPDLPRLLSCRSCGEQFAEPSDLRLHTITAHLPISIPQQPSDEAAAAATMASAGATAEVAAAAGEDSGPMMQFTHIEIDLGLYQQVSQADVGELSVELRRCPECHEYVADLRAHAETHMCKNYVCEECGRSFAGRRELAPHAAQHRLERAGAGARPAAYPCPYCGKAFRTPQSLSIHRALHNPARDFVCQQCGKRFKANGRLRKHLATHAASKRYACPACGRRFAQKCNMVRHQRTHTGERPYACDRCERRFNHKVSLGRHLSKEHAVEVERTARRTVEGVENFSAHRLASGRAKRKVQPKSEGGD